MWQNIAVIVVVAIAAVLVGRRLWRTIGSKDSAGCGCHGADESNPACQDCAALSDPNAACPSETGGPCPGKKEPEA